MSQAEFQRRREWRWVVPQPAAADVEVKSLAPLSIQKGDTDDEDIQKTTHYGGYSGKL